MERQVINDIKIIFQSLFCLSSKQLVNQVALLKQITSKLSILHMVCIKEYVICKYTYRHAYNILWSMYYIYKRTYTLIGHHADHNDNENNITESLRLEKTFKIMQIRKKHVILTHQT